MRYIGKGTHHVSLYIPFLTYVRHCNFTNLWPVISLSPIVRCTTSVATQPEKIEVFINDKPVYVYPGTTVLQVCIPRDYSLTGKAVSHSHTARSPRRQILLKVQ